MIQIKLWLQWVAVSAIGWVMGLIATQLAYFSLIRLLKYSIALALPNDVGFDALSEVLHDNVGDGIPGHFIGVPAALGFGALFGVLYGAVFGVTGGLAQSLVLRRYLSQSHLWVLASALAWACLLGVLWAWAWAWGWYGPISSPKTAWGALGAVLVGTVEWLVLRRHVSNAYWWTVATVVTWVVSRWAALEIQQTSFFFPLSWAWLIVGVGHGVVTGCVLVWLLQPPRRSE